MNPRIYVAFRFHVNLYHSYRGDTPDEKGFGKDIRIIRHVLDVLDDADARGIPAKGTWDIDNHYSLGRYIPRHCPDIAERIRGRVERGLDEVEIMCWDNGMITAHTAEEAALAVRNAISNSEKSGVKDVFGKYAPVVRPQENMMTPSLVRVYNEAGIEAVSLYYSGIPFNCFGSFVPLLEAGKRFNPLWYETEEYGRIKILPCVNPGDIVDRLGIMNYLRFMRREQKKIQRDLLLLIDMDADDDFWVGYVDSRLSGIAGRQPSGRYGLRRYLDMLSKLDYVEFCTPYEYLKTHEPAGTVSFTQDTADGSWDGYASWSDKLENTKLWTLYDRSRQTAAYARSLSDSPAIRGLTAALAEERMPVSSTTHFGLSTPVMCVPRLRQARDAAERANASADAVFDRAAALSGGGNTVVFNRDYVDLSLNQRGLVPADAGTEFVFDGVVSSFERRRFGKEERVAVYDGKAENRPYSEGSVDGAEKIISTAAGISNGFLTLEIEDSGLAVSRNGERVADPGSFSSRIVYAGREASPRNRRFSAENAGAYGTVTEKGELSLAGGVGTAKYEKVFTLVPGLPYLYADCEISYPETPARGVNPGRAAALRRTYDTRWREIAPMEIIPSFRGSDGDPIRVYKHNFMGAKTSFALDSRLYTKNRNLYASNNAVTCGYVAFANSGRGILVAQSSTADNSFAFMKTRLLRRRGEDVLYLNPMGVYFGKQLRYNTSRWGIGTAAAKTGGEGYASSAPSFGGGRQRFSLMIAFYDGGKPGDGLVNDALFHAFPPRLLPAGR